MYKSMLKEIFKEYEKTRDYELFLKNKRIAEVYEKIPRIKFLDEEISKTGLEMAKLVLAKPEDYENIVLNTRDKINKLEMEKAYLLTESNIKKDYMDLNYKCNICKDKAYKENGDQCICLKQELISRAYKMSNIEKLLAKENFASFRLDIFSDEKFETEPLSPRENMEEILKVAQNFIRNFKEDNGENLLFYGTTGLGKTFLSNCIAKELIDSNQVVIYQTAFTILEILANHRFRRGETEFNDFQYDQLFQCDLLIIDDLGTEISNSFTNAEIFNIVNTRIISGKKTIISTNLTPKEISNIYTDRVFSRVLDKFMPFKFYGPDLRWEIK